MRILILANKMYPSITYIRERIRSIVRTGPIVLRRGPGQMETGMTWIDNKEMLSSLPLMKI